MFKTTFVFPDDILRFAEELAGASDCGPDRGRHRHRRRHGHHHPGHGHQHADHMEGGPGGFGVRRPLRYMARQLDLDQEQVDALAAILKDLKTERAQARVDNERALSAFAEAFGGGDFDAEGAKSGAERRKAAHAAVEDAVLKCLTKTHALLRPEQRKKLAAMLRQGTLTI